MARRRAPPAGAAHSGNPPCSWLPVPFRDTILQEAPRTIRVLRCPVRVSVSSNSPVSCRWAKARVPFPALRGRIQGLRSAAWFSIFPCSAKWGPVMGMVFLILLALLGITLLGSLVCLIWMVAVKFSNGDRRHLRNNRGRFDRVCRCKRASYYYALYVAPRNAAIPSMIVAGCFAGVTMGTYMDSYRR